VSNVRVASVVDSNRYGLTNEDLNRRWSSPNRIYHPVIYHTKGLMEYCARVLQRPPHVFVDYHGHSRRKNVFLFGCSRSGSWSAADRAKPDQPVQYLVRESRLGNIFRSRARHHLSLRLPATGPARRTFITLSETVLSTRTFDLHKQLLADAATTVSPIRFARPSPSPSPSQLATLMCRYSEFHLSGKLRSVKMFLFSWTF
jgi:hypothetical protein